MSTSVQPVSMVSFSELLRRRQQGRRGVGRQFAIRRRRAVNLRARRRIYNRFTYLLWRARRRLHTRRVRRFRQLADHRRRARQQRVNQHVQAINRFIHRLRQRHPSWSAERLQAYALAVYRRDAAAQLRNRRRRRGR